MKKKFTNVTHVTKIFESIAAPHTYSTYAKFSRVGKSNVELLAGPKCNLESAVNEFKQFFREQTGKEWDERASGMMPPPKRDVDGNSLPVHEGWFYLDEKTTLLGAYLRYYPSKDPKISTDDTEDMATDEHGIEVEIANYRIEDRVNTEADAGEDTAEGE
jgi:hypothetical protein